jgi:hypothetical protein
MVAEGPLKNRAARGRARHLFDGLKRLSGLGATARLHLATIPVKFDRQFGPVQVLASEEEAKERADLVKDLAALRARLEAEVL